MSSAPAAPRGWPVERVLFAVAGTVTLLSVALTALVSPWFVLPAAFVGGLPVALCPGLRRPGALVPGLDTGPVAVFSFALSGTQPP